MPHRTIEYYDNGVLVRTEQIDISQEEENENLIDERIRNGFALIDSIINQSSIPSGTLTTAQLSNAVRQAQQDRIRMAKAIKLLGRATVREFGGALEV